MPPENNQNPWGNVPIYSIRHNNVEEIIFKCLGTNNNVDHIAYDK